MGYYQVPLRAWLEAAEKGELKSVVSDLRREIWRWEDRRGMEDVPGGSEPKNVFDVQLRLDKLAEFASSS